MSSKNDGGLCAHDFSEPITGGMRCSKCGASDQNTYRTDKPNTPDHGPVKAIEYRPDGSVKRVEYHPAPVEETIRIRAYSQPRRRVRRQTWGEWIFGC